MDGRQKNMLLGLGLFFIWFVIGFLILQSQLGEELLAFFAAAKLSIFCVTGIFAFLGINYGYFEIKEMSQVIKDLGPAKITEINKTISPLTVISVFGVMSLLLGAFLVLHYLIADNAHALITSAFLLMLVGLGASIMWTILFISSFLAKRYHK